MQTRGRWSKVCHSLKTILLFPQKLIIEKVQKVLNVNSREVVKVGPPASVNILRVCSILDQTSCFSVFKWFLNLKFFQANIYSKLWIDNPDLIHVHLSIYLSIYLPTYLFIYLSVYIHIYIYIYIYIYIMYVIYYLYI